MAESPDHLSFTDPSTEFYLPHWPTTNRACGHHAGEPTGEVVCLTCWRSDLNIDEIDHDPTCPQRHVHSRYWRERRSAGAD